jgi:protein regulator of cytokinesis 1
MTPTPRRNSVGSGTPELLTPRSYSGRQNGYFKEMRRLSTAPLNFVAISKEDTMSYASIYGSESGSPPRLN